MLNCFQFYKKNSHKSSLNLFCFLMGPVFYIFGWRTKRQKNLKIFFKYKKIPTVFFCFAMYFATILCSACYKSKAIESLRIVIFVIVWKYIIKIRIKVFIYLWTLYSRFDYLLLAVWNQNSIFAVISHDYSWFLMVISEWICTQQGSYRYSRFCGSFAERKQRKYRGLPVSL